MKPINFGPTIHKGLNTNSKEVGGQSVAEGLGHGHHVKNVLQEIEKYFLFSTTGLPLLKWQFYF